MDVVLLAVIGLVLLFGMVAFGVGHKGWSWSTVAAAVLLLLAASGYLFLAARLAERERSWRAVVNKNQVEIDRIRGAGDPGAAAEAKSVAGLQYTRQRWARALAFVDTWHGRSWKKASLAPPRPDKNKPGMVSPGTISIPMPSEKAGDSPLDVGAEIAVFDDVNVADEGRFLGLFRVQAVNAQVGSETATLTIVPASTPVPPSKADLKLWTRDYEEVTVYESLPTDRWLAFHTTPADGSGGDDPVGGSGSASRWRPQPRKTSAEELLGNLEEQMDEFKKHGESVPEDEWPKLKEQLAGGEIPPGHYWAVVTFLKNVKFTKLKFPKKGVFSLDAGGDAAEAGGDAAEADEAVGPPGEMIEPAAPIEAVDAIDDGVDGEATAGSVSNRFKTKLFEAGETAEFDLQTAFELQDDQQFARLTSVLFRRPLADPQLAIRGGQFATTEGGQTVRAEGMDLLRQGLLEEMAAIEQATTRIKTSHDNVLLQAGAFAEQSKQLGGDLTLWQKDVTAAAETVGAFDERLRAATIELASLENSIVRLGKELSGASAVLTRSIDAASPPPGRLPQ